MSPLIRRRALGILRRCLRAGTGFLLVSLSVAALYPSSSAQAAQATNFSVLVNGSTSATMPTTGTATLSVSGFPSTTAGVVTFEVDGDTNCFIDLTGKPNEGTSCSADPLPGPGTYAFTATFYGPDDNGDIYDLTSSNSATLTISGQTSFTIAVNGSSSAMIVPGGTADLTLVGLPFSVAGPVTYSANGTVICTDDLTVNEQQGCYSSPSLPVGTYSITATFTDTDGVYSGSTSSNTVTLIVSTQTNFTISNSQFSVDPRIDAVDHFQFFRDSVRNRIAIHGNRGGDFQRERNCPLFGRFDGRVRRSNRLRALNTSRNRLRNHSNVHR